MAQKVQVILVDDIDGGEAEESVSFSLDGAAYEIDLNAKNAEKLREALAPWVGHARRVSGRGRSAGRPAAKAKSAKRADLADVRAWARSKGHEVSDRGRISAEIMDAYDAAH
ncbi:Lsr2 family protein [Spongisporangium articulatum]|uniref:Lsr2 family protein n=1 Tax=Spongisporangium articulatum TaxID=3362603 RepID=A0ABW8ANI6_9ACTN